LRTCRTPPPPPVRQATECSTFSCLRRRATCGLRRHSTGCSGFRVYGSVDVAFGSEAVIVTVVLRRKRPVCSGCDARGLKIKDHREKRWRHLDLGAPRCVIECRLRRLYCRGCGDVYEAVPWARAGSPYTRDFDDLCAWLAQQMSQTQVTNLMRIAWESVGKILERVVADKLDHGRLDGLVWIGCDEVSYSADHKFLTCVADHSKGLIVWAPPGRNAQTSQAFFDSLTDDGKARSGGDRDDPAEWRHGLRASAASARPSATCASHQRRY
jgi:Helix-turn-helix domain of transposase family ISL3/zinc-finger of transposase IS204/IS1001/IS1096/IS1165/Transposase